MYIISNQTTTKNNYICPKISFWEPFFHWTFSFHFIAGEFFLGMVSAFVHCWVSLLFDLVVACWGCNLCRPLCGYNTFCEWNVMTWTVHRVLNMKPSVYQDILHNSSRHAEESLHPAKCLIALQIKCCGIPQCFSFIRTTTSFFKER